MYGRESRTVSIIPNKYPYSIDRAECFFRSARDSKNEYPADISSLGHESGMNTIHYLNVNRYQFRIYIYIMILLFRKNNSGGLLTENTNFTMAEITGT